MALYRYKTTWNGLIGLPGYTFTYAAGNNLAPSQIAIFWDSIKQYFPAGLKWTVDPTIVQLDEATGKMTGVTTQPQPADVAATGSTSYVPQAGAQIKWYTQGFSNGRKVVGRTYLVPLITPSWSTNGLIPQATCNAINAAADALRTGSAATLVVWHRPVYKDAAVPGDPPVLVRPGASFGITSQACPTRSVSLRTRQS